MEKLIGMTIKEALDYMYEKEICHFTYRIVEYEPDDYMSHRLSFEMEGDKIKKVYRR